MGESGKYFKTAAFGGFHKEDVLNYIQKTADEKAREIASYKDEIALLKKEYEELSKECGALKGENDGLQEKNAELLERLGQMTIDLEKCTAQDGTAETKYQNLQQEQQVLQEENSRLRKALSAAEQNAAEAKEQLQACERECRDYKAAKENIAEIELAAYRRASEMEEGALVDARNIRLQSAQIISDVKLRIGETLDRYVSFLRQAEREWDKIKNQAAGAEESLSDLVEALDQAVVSELSKNSQTSQEKKRVTLEDISRKFFTDNGTMEEKTNDGAL